MVSSGKKSSVSSQVPYMLVDADKSTRQPYKTTVYNHGRIDLANQADDDFYDDEEGGGGGDGPSARRSTLPYDQQRRNDYSLEVTDWDGRLQDSFFNYVKRTPDYDKNEVPWDRNDNGPVQVQMSAYLRYDDNLAFKNTFCRSSSDLHLRT